ncbi:DUF2637 domain-containing protein [Streptomyces dangxiongensis]|uniref:DUF2637 domain-containing protein n=2 Tax=Streptomyces dangxiongensis TaxID=1442032 RepID=A0A3G2JMH6_9ACTN|nr:DUF2637 domain-containing protein [Streptomyces dangxiongensis]
MGLYPEPPVEYPDGYQDNRGRHRASADDFHSHLTPPDSNWDPAEELAFMLRDAIEQQPMIPTARQEDCLAGTGPMPPDETFVDVTAEPLPMRSAPRGHRKVRVRQRPNKIRIATRFIAALVTAIASAVSIFGGLIAYDPLRLVAVSRMQSSAVSWWPLLVFGPWLVASLSILRAALHQRRALHSWSMLLVFSAIAMALCIAQAPRNVIGIAAAALPCFASLACFQQVVRQITLTRPPRRTLPRHRLGLAGARAAEAPDGRLPPGGTSSAYGDLARDHQRLGEPRAFGRTGDIL